MNLKTKLDKEFSRYIRLRDASHGGYGFCITCGKLVHWKRGDCGHYIKRQYLATRWDETNCNLQCKGCNCFEQGANEQYKPAIDSKWGNGTSGKLESRKRNKTDYRAWWFEVKIKDYAERARKLEGGSKS